MKRIIFLSILSLFIFTGCHPIGGGIYVDGHYSHGQPVPPSHAPAYGRRHHMYHYYPNAEFYFDVGRNMYFYLDTRGQWTFSVNLPLHLRSHLYNGYVEIEMENDRPYLKHKHHKYKYNQREYKKRWKYTRPNKYKRNYKYENRNKYLDDGKYKNNRKYERKREYLDDGKYKNNRKYERKRQHLDDGKYKNNRKHDRDRKSSDEGKYKDKKNKKRKKYEDDDDNDKRRNNDRRHDRD